MQSANVPIFTSTISSETNYSMMLVQHNVWKCPSCYYFYCIR